MKKRSAKNYPISNWQEYNESLVKRGSLSIWIEKEVIDNWVSQTRSGKKGAPEIYQDRVIECILTVMAIYGLPLRQAEGFMNSIVKLMNLELSIPDYTTICRRRKTLKIALKVNKISNNKPLHLVVDSTGIKIYGEGEWKVRQHGVSKRRTWRKLHLGVDESTGQILSAVCTTNDVSDDEVFGELIEQVEPPIKQVSADGAYDKTKCYRVLKSRKIRAVIPPRKNARISQHGNSNKAPLARDQNIRSIRKIGRASWKKQSNYHRRSIAETTMFRYKNSFSDKASPRIFESQATDIFIRCNALNKFNSLGNPLHLH